MGRLPDDVLEFVKARFALRDRNELASMLRQDSQMAPRVLRAVLFLSDGSLIQLRHYLEEARKDVREVILAAEYVTGVAAEPLHLRDMSEPFWSERNLGATFGHAVCPARPVRARKVAPAKSREGQQMLGHHAALYNRRFELGSITYLVMKDQPSAKLVRCLRIENNVTNLVRLPLEFVLEQLAEHIELSPLRSVG